MDSSLRPAAGAALPAHPEGQGLALMVAGGLLLGTLGVFLEEAGQHPLTAVWFRCAFGLLALLAWGLLTHRLGELRLRGTACAAAVSAGLLMVLNWALFFGAIERTSIGVATVVFHVQPLWVMAFGALRWREPVGGRRVAAALAALGGLALASGLLEGEASAKVDARYLAGLLMCLGGSLSYAAVTLIAKGARGPSSFALACWQCAVGLLALLWWPLAHGWPSAAAAWGWLAGMGVLHTGLAYVLLYAGMARLPAARVALLQFVYPAAAVLVDWAAYGRGLSAGQALGMLVMGAALSAARSPGPR